MRNLRQHTVDALSLELPQSECVAASWLCPDPENAWQAPHLEDGFQDVVTAHPPPYNPYRDRLELQRRRALASTTEDGGCNCYCKGTWLLRFFRGFVVLALAVLTYFVVTQHNRLDAQEAQNQAMVAMVKKLNSLTAKSGGEMTVNHTSSTDRTTKAPASTAEEYNETSDELRMDITANAASIDQHSQAIDANAATSDELRVDITANAASIEQLRQAIDANAASIKSEEAALARLWLKSQIDKNVTTLVKTAIPVNLAVGECENLLPGAHVLGSFIDPRSTVGVVMGVCVWVCVLVCAGVCVCVRARTHTYTI